MASLFDQNDEFLLAELAPTHTVKELVAKWEDDRIGYYEMYNFLRLKGIKAKKEPKHKLAGALRNKSAKGLHISQKIAQILEMSKQGKCVNVIAFELKLTPNYVNRMRQVYGVTDKDEFNREMFAKVENVLARSRQYDEPAYLSALVLYGWTKGKYNYWRKIKKAAKK
jgi:hypothetical protein